LGTPRIRPGPLLARLARRRGRRGPGALHGRDARPRAPRARPHRDRHRGHGDPRARRPDGALASRGPGSRPRTPARGDPPADALGDLVALYERAWFGLREPATAEAERARSLALRAAA